MAKIVAYLAVFFLTMNLFAGVLMSTGVAGMLGMETNVGGDEEVDEAVNKSDKVSSGAPSGSTLFGMYNVLADGFSTLALPVTAGPTMLNRAGVPGVITFGILQPIIGFVYAIGVISLLMRFGVL